MVSAVIVDRQWVREQASEGRGGVRIVVVIRRILMTDILIEVAGYRVALTT
jgi:hypothetical protein